jgi:hypothetical protein
VSAPAEGRPGDEWGAAVASGCEEREGDEGGATATLAKVSGWKGGGVVRGCRAEENGRGREGDQEVGSGGLPD